MRCATDPLVAAMTAGARQALQKAAAAASLAAEAHMIEVSHHGVVIRASTPESTMAARRARLWGQLADEIGGIVAAAFDADDRQQ